MGKDVKSTLEDAVRRQTETRKAMAEVRKRLAEIERKKREAAVPPPA